MFYSRALRRAAAGKARRPSEGIFFPPEVLENIFLHCLELDYPLKGKAVLLSSERDIPIVFTLVNKRWRDLALSYAPLWDWEVEIPTPLGAALAKPFQLYCKLSGNASQPSEEDFASYTSRPLIPGIIANRKSLMRTQRVETLLLRMHPEWITLNTRHISDLFNYMGSTITRLTFLGFHARILAKIPTGLFPSLEEITIKELQGLSDSLPQVIRAFDNSPRLRKVTVPREFLDLADTGLLLLQWTQITYLDVVDEEGSGNPFPLERYLSWCENLETLELLVSPFDATDSQSVVPTLCPETPITPIDPPKLACLVIKVFIPTMHNQMLDYGILHPIRLSNLNSLVIRTTKDAKPPAGHQFESTVRSALTNSQGIGLLSVEFRIRSNEDVSAMLRLLDATAPRALELSVHRQDILLVFSMLSRYVSSTLKAPSALKYLTLCWGRDGDCWGTDLANFLKSREFRDFVTAWPKGWTGIPIRIVHPLRTFPSHVAEGVHCALREQGLECSLKLPCYPQAV